MLRRPGKSIQRALMSRLGSTKDGATKSRVPQDLQDHPLLAFLHLAERRPVDLPGLRAAIAEQATQARIDKDLESILERLADHAPSRADAANLFVASLRGLCDVDLELGLDFADRLLWRFPDRRALRSMVTFHGRAKNFQRALSLLELLEPSEWVDKNRNSLLRRIEHADDTAQCGYVRYIGYESLAHTPPPTILLYGDMNLNVIDGSAVWLASVAEALCGAGMQVHLLLRYNIERSLLLQPLIDRPGIELIEPHTFGYRDLSQQRAVAAIEILDGVYSYRMILLRGMRIGELVAGKKSLWQRVWAYLTDFYTVSKGGPVLAQDAGNAFADFAQLFDRFLVQTPQVRKFMLDELSIPSGQSLELPPLIPDEILQRASVATKQSPSRPYRIGYAGKITPHWGVLELVKTARALHDAGHELEVHIIGDKIHANTEEYPSFKDDVIEALTTSPFLTWHKGLSRTQTVELMAELDLGWCYRDPQLELSTLELSTKLLECIAVGLPVILTRNDINEQLLGNDYPLFAERADDLLGLVVNLLQGSVKVDFATPHYRSIAERHSISNARSQILAPALQPLREVEPGKRIVFAGNDFKFISEYESHLKRLGHIVRRDEWEWGRPKDERQSHYLAQWADVVFCEWALAASVWYSQNLSPAKRLVVRLHSQEVHKRGRIFPPQLEMANVDAVIFVSDAIRSKAVTDFGWTQDSLHTIPNYVNTAFFARPKLANAQFRIGIVGIIPSMKRLDRALDLIRYLRQRDRRFQLVIKGHRPAELPWSLKAPAETKYYRDQFERIEKDQLLAEGVVFEGHSPRLGAWYQTIGSVLSPSDFESFHYAVAEGASSGALPLVWPWDGADRLYPGEWQVASSEKATERLVAWASLGDVQRQERGEQFRQVIRDRYGMDGVFSQLNQILLPS